MANEPEIITEDGEIVTGTALSVLDTSALSAIIKAEIDMQISTARAYPRSITKAMQNILTLTTMDEETAEEAIYALPRGGKPIRGPSIRLAETIAQCWGNNRNDTRVIMVDRKEKVIIAEGLFHDLETNMAARATVRRRIVDKKGNLFNDDMIIVTGNAACSIAKRNAILAGVPKGVWRKAYKAAEQVIAGDVTMLSVTRNKAISALAHYGLTPDQVFVIIGVKGIDDISIGHIPTLRGAFSALKNGEVTVEELIRTSGGGKAVSDHTKIDNPLKDDAPAGDVSDAPVEIEAAALTPEQMGRAAFHADVALKDVPADQKDGWKSAKAEQDAAVGDDDTFPGDRA